MNIDEARAAANPGTGLVPLRILKPFMPYRDGDIAGFPPDVAVQHVANQVAERYKAPKGGEKSEPVPVNPAPVPGLVYQPIDKTKYEGRPEISPLAQVAPNVQTGAPERALEKADIPENWQELSVAQRRSLASALSLRKYQEISGEEANAIIEAAAAGEVPPPPSGEDPANGSSGETGDE